jgi:prolyl 4-hydroxylase
MQQAIIPGFLTEPECQQIIDIARNKGVQPSKGWDTTTGTEHISDYRTSEHTFIARTESPLFQSIAQRIAQITGFPVENQENIQVAHYQPGKHYKVHWDYFDPSWGGSASAFARGGNRVITFMIYLNTIPEGYGGETNFNMAGLAIRPDMGKACMWYNLYSNRTVDKSTSHEGRPPKEPYEKWISTIWVREKAFI